MSERLCYKPAEAAELLGVSVQSLYRYVKAGDIPSEKIGGRIVIPAAALHRMFNTPPEEAE